MAPPIVRPARQSDLPAILAIYNDAVLNETCIWIDTPVDLAERRAWWQARVAQGYPVLVAETTGEVVGYASFGNFRPFEGYRFTVEHSVYIASEARRRGVGTLLLTRLIEEARTLRKHAMVGGIGADNAASRMPELGFKFGRWQDLVFVQKIL
jgi:phosphinothricin acetyltransferase